MTLSGGSYGSSSFGGFATAPSQRLLDNLNESSVILILLAEITCGHKIDWWEHYTYVTSGNLVWRSPLAFTLKEFFADGQPLTLRANIQDTIDNLGTWYSDGAYVYVRLPDDGDPRDLDRTLQAIIRFRFANIPKDLDGSHWDSRIVGFPDLSLILEPTFTNLAQVGSGTLPLANGDRFFNDLQDFEWDAGQTLLYVGADVPNRDPLGFDEYYPFAKNWNDSINFTSDQFVLNLREAKGRADKNIPFDTYTQDEFPAINETCIGNPKPWAYGTVLGVPATAIDVANRIFKVADHPILSFDGVRVSTNTGWQTVDFATTDLVNAEFSLAAADWNGQDTVSVDFSGKAGDDGFLMNNPADIILDILRQIGTDDSDIDLESFTRAKYRLQIGVTTGNTQLPVFDTEIALYLDSSVSALDTIGQINSTVRGYLFSDALGRFRYELFWPQPGEGLPTILDNHIVSLTKINHNGQETSQVIASYANRTAEKWNQVAIATDPEAQYLRRDGSAVVELYSLPLVKTRQALNWAYMRLVEARRPWVEYDIEVSWTFFLSQVAQYIHLNSTIHGVDAVLEILGVEWNLGVGTVTLTLSDAHGWGSSNGFWVGDGNVVPARFSSDPGYNGGDPTWTGNESDSLAAWKKQNCGFWTEQNGFAKQADSRSRPVSRWFR